MMPRYALLSIGLVLIAGIVSADTALLYPPNGANAYLTNNTDNTFTFERNGIGDQLQNSSAGTYAIGQNTATTSNVYSWSSIGAFCVNTATLLPNSTVNSATLYLYPNPTTPYYTTLGTTYFGMTGITPDNPSSLKATDYNKFLNTRYTNDIIATSWTAGSYHGFPFNAAGLAAIDKSGWTCVAVRSANHIDDNTANLTWSSNTRAAITNYYSDYAGTDRDPYFSFEFTPADITPPASLSGFANITSCSGTNISFTRPSDTDYNGFEVWWNNAAETNQTNTTTWYNKSGLTESTTYTLSTKTFDLSGNVNATFQNYSITTSACGVAPVAAFSASNITMCAGNVTRFTDESTNTPTSWYWEFGDGNTSTTQSPLVQYDVVGLKTVNLKATNAYGSDWENKTGYINVTTCAAPTPTPTPTPTTATPTPTPTTPPTYSNLWCGIQDVYLQDVPSGIDGFRDLRNYASGNALVDENVTITDASGVVFIDSYISPPGALTNVKLLEGLRNYNIYGYVSSVSQPSYFTFNVSKYDTATNTEVFFYNISSVAISSVTPTLDKTYYTSQKNVSFTSTERILIRIGAYTTRNTATTVHFLNQGTTPTYVQSGYFQCPVVSGGGNYAYQQPSTPIPAAIPLIAIVGALVLVAYARGKK